MTSWSIARAWCSLALFTSAACAAGVAGAVPLLAGFGGPTGYGLPEHCLHPSDDGSYAGPPPTTGSPAVPVDLTPAFSSGLRYFGIEHRAIDHDDLLNDFQLVLTSPNLCRSTGDFDVEFRYNRCEWSTGDGGSGAIGPVPAQVGFDAGNRRNYVTLPMSRTRAIVEVCRLSNVPAAAARAATPARRRPARASVRAGSAAGRGNAWSTWTHRRMPPRRVATSARRSTRRPHPTGARGWSVRSKAGARAPRPPRRRAHTASR